MNRIVWGAVVFILLAGLYLFLAGSVDAVELTAMGICATAGTSLAIALEVVAKRNYRPMPPLKALLKPAAALLPEAWTVGRDLVTATLSGTTRMRGTFVKQPFEPGDDTPREAARRALTIVGLSLAPRTIVIRGERTGELLLHGLPPKPASADHSWPA